MPRRKAAIRLTGLIAAAALALVACSSPPADREGGREVTTDAEDLRAEWDSARATVVQFSGDQVKVRGQGATAQGGDLYIYAAGVYVLEGQLDNGQVLVDAQNNGTVQIVLNGVELHNETSAAIYVKQADKTILTLAEGTTNRVSDGPNYADTTTEDAPKAAIYSMDDLEINGSGALEVEGRFDVGIQSKDDLRIMGGEIIVKAVDDGVIGRDLLYVLDGTLRVEAGGDALKATNDKDPERGRVVIEGGTFQLTAGSDGIQAETSLEIRGGDFTITTGGGHTNGVTKTETFEPWGRGFPGGGFPWGGGLPEGGRPGRRMPGGDGTGTGTPPDMGPPPAPDSPFAGGNAPGATPAGADAAGSTSTSAKGLKANTQILIAGGRFTIDSADDAIHSDGSIQITAGEMTILSGDDGIHANRSLVIAGGTISVQQSYEGLEALEITISGGTIDVVSADDGVNAAGGADRSSIGGRPGQNFFEGDDGWIRIEGGTLTVTARGDGIDVNGSITMTGGTVLINGPVSNNNGALDYNRRFEISGGTLIAAGSAGMAMTPSEQSAQHTVSMLFTSPPAAGTRVSLRDAEGNEMAGMELKQPYPSVVISVPNLSLGEQYGIYAGEEEVVRFTLGQPVTWLTEAGVTTAPRTFPGWRR